MSEKKGGLLLTGATGFVGRALTQKLAHDGWQIRSAVRYTHSQPMSIAVGDINPSTNWDGAFTGCKTVVHLAARTQITPNKDSKDVQAEFRRVNTAGTLNLARQAAAAGVPRFVFLSSAKVNGEGAPYLRKQFSHKASLSISARNVYSEADAPAPQGAYAISKWEAEQGLLTIARETGMEVVIIRPPLIYGPGVKGNFALMLRWVCKGVPLPLGAVHNRRSLIALDNLVDFIALCADREHSPLAVNEVFLVSDGEDVSTPELLRKIARAYETKARLLPLPAAWLGFGAKLLGKTASMDRLLGSLVVDSSKARNLLGWRPVASMDDQLRKMARDASYT